MSEIDSALPTAILSHAPRQDYITHVRPDHSGAPILEVPTAIQREAAIELGSEVEWKRLEDGTITITIAPPTNYRLDDLVAGITPENRHEYIDTGNPIGQEIW
jgi:antitoxin MazE